MREQEGNRNKALRRQSREAQERDRGDIWGNLSEIKRGIRGRRWVQRRTDGGTDETILLLSLKPLKAGITAGHK